MEGTQLGPYLIVEELGAGGMGTVYRAEVVGRVPGLAAGCQVALKIIHTHLLETPGFFQRFLREADIGRSVQHDNVVRTYLADALVHEGHQQNFLVMEYVEGQNLRDLLNELERVPEELCRHIGCEVAKGLQAIHGAGVVHRDVKPENVLITPDHVVKVMDLGVARLQDEAIRLSRAGAFAGSLEYAAPEQFRSQQGEPDGRADLHALGVVLYELSTGRNPYRDEDAASVLRRILDQQPMRAGDVNPQLSPFFEEVVHTLLAKDRDQRFGAASDLAHVFEEGESSEWWKARARAIRVETKRPLRRIRVPRETDLYGRDDDLAGLRALYDKAKGGDGRVLLIEGEAGIGKTRLVDEFVGRLHQAGEDVNFLFGAYPPGGAATAAGAFSTAYREHFGAEGLEEMLAEYLTVTPLLIPAFAALLKGDILPEGREPLTKDSLQTVFVHATRSLARERPTVVLIDDLHFAPEEGRALFASLALAVPGQRILLIGTMRPGVPEEWTADVERQEHTGRILLARLGPKDLGKLLIDAFRSERLATELGLRIATKSDGNPFFAFEIIRGLREGEFITQQPDGTWVPTKVIREIQVPSSVVDLVNARVAGLSEEERDLLDVASCCGFGFDPLLVGEAVGLGRIPVLKRFAQVERRHRLVRASGSSYAFDHHQVQEALYGSLADPLKQEYHAALAEALETRESAASADPEDLDGQVCVDLCEHNLKGARGEKALRYLDGSLAYLEKGYLNDQAVALADRVLAVDDLLVGPGRARILLRKQDRLHLMGHRQEQQAALDEARETAEAGDDKETLCQVVAATGRLQSALGDFAKAAQHYQQALTLARELGDREEEARAAGNLGHAFSRLGRYPESLEQCEHCLTIARETGDSRAELTAETVLGGHLVRRGRYEEARERYHRSLELSRLIGDRQGEAYAHGNLGNLSMSQGRYEEARKHQERWLSMSSEMGDRQGAASATGNLGIIFLRMGELQEATERFEQHRSLAREIGDRQGEVNATANLALVYEITGHYGRARDHNEISLRLARERGMRRSEIFIAGNLGGILRALGRHGAAREILDGLLVQARDDGNRRSEGHVLGELALIAMQEDDLEHALELAKEHLALEQEMGTKDRLIEAHTSLGAIEASRHDMKAAVRHFEAAIELAAEIDDPQCAVLARAHRAGLPGGAGAAEVAAVESSLDRGSLATRLELRFLLWEATGSSEHLREAKRLLDHLVEHAPEDCHVSVIENVPLHRDVAKAWEAAGPERTQGKHEGA